VAGSSKITILANALVTALAVVVLIGIGAIISGLYFCNQLSMPLVREAEYAALRMGAIPGEPRGRVFIGGDVSCGAWTQARRQNRQTYQWWVAGFLSGLNYEGDPSRDPLDGNDFAGIAAWIDNYCRENPLKRITYASIELMKLLRPSDKPSQ
jgi:hypothetical protein